MTEPVQPAETLRSPHPALRARTVGGFTILEIVISLGILATGLAAVMAMFVHNARLAEMAREQVIQAIIFGDLKSKQQMAALLQVDAGGRDNFDRNDWGLISPPAVDNWPASRAKYDALVDPGTTDYQYDNIVTYTGFIFRVEQFQFVGEGAGAKSPIGDKWRMQFTDWDGYEPSVSQFGVDVNGDEDPANHLGESNLRLITEFDVNQDVNNDGVIDADTPIGPAAVPGGSAGHYTLDPGFRFGPAYPSANLTYDEAGMRHYWKKLKCTLVWHIGMVSDAERDNWFLNGPTQLKLGRYRSFDFTIYNPDVDKD